MYRLRKYGQYYRYFIQNNCQSVCNIKHIFKKEVLSKYIFDNDKLEKIEKYIDNYKVDNYGSFLLDCDCFAKENNIKVQLNNYTRDCFSPSRKLMAYLYQRSSCSFLKVFFKDKSVKIGNGISFDLSLENLKIDTKLKNGKKKIDQSKLKDLQVTIAANSTQNGNQSDFYLFGSCQRNYWCEDNIINFNVLGIINKEKFFQLARRRNIGQQIVTRDNKPVYYDGKPMCATKQQYVIYADNLMSIDQFSKKYH